MDVLCYQRGRFALVVWTVCATSESVRLSTLEAQRYMQPKPKAAERVRADQTQRTLAYGV